MQLLFEILAGDEPRGRPSKPNIRSLTAGIASGEDGMLSFVTLIVLLGFVILIGYVGNVGHATTEKLEVQCAADSAAYSAALWQARGMNAVTTTNHMMGELTALMVIIESFGGPELDGEKEETEESKTQNSFINLGLAGSLDALGLPDAITDVVKDQVLHPLGSFSATVRPYDVPFVEQVQALMAEDDAGEHDAGGAIYDAQMTLKYWVGYGFCAKGFVNIGYVVATVLSLGTGESAASMACCGGHIAIDLAVAWICKDWILVKGIEYVALSLRPFNEAAPFLLAGLSLYADSVAQPGRLQEPIEGTLDSLKGALDVDELDVMPAPEEIRLPLAREPQPSGGESGVPPTLWGKNEDKRSDFVAAIKAPLDAIDTIIDAANTIIDIVTSTPIGLIVGEVLDAAGISTNIPTTQDMMRDLAAEDPPKWPKEPVELNRDPDLSFDPGGWGYPHNPSLVIDSDGSDPTLPEFEWEAESRSQWVRATYPYVHAFRAPLLNLFEDILGPANLWTYYTNWTNRYTLVIVHELRSESVFGYQPHMHVMANGPGFSIGGPLLEEQDPVESLKKGQEQWTRDDTQGERLAIDYFTLAATAHRNQVDPAFSPSIFTNPSTGVSAIAESMFYNANGRSIGGPSNAQPNTGWDTLNWVPPVAAPEWSGIDPLYQGGVDALFSGSLAAPSASRVRLNWQAKLVPIDSIRSSEAEESVDYLQLPDDLDLLH